MVVSYVTPNIGNRFYVCVIGEEGQRVHRQDSIEYTLNQVDTKRASTLSSEQGYIIAL
jgi:hypothetical protein